jgi:hypothetical protein
VSVDGDRALLGVDVADTPAGGDDRDWAAIAAAGAPGHEPQEGLTPTWYRS